MEDSTTTPFDFAVRNDVDRFHLARDVLDPLPALGASADFVSQTIRDKLVAHKRYIAEHGADMPEIQNWRWRNSG